MSANKVNSRPCNYCCEQGMLCEVVGPHTWSCVACKKCHKLCRWGGELVTGQKRKWAVLEPEESEEMEVVEDAKVEEVIPKLQK